MNSDALDTINIRDFIEQYKISMEPPIYVGRFTSIYHWQHDRWSVQLVCEYADRRAATMPYCMGTGHEGQPPTLEAVLDAAADNAAWIQDVTSFEMYAEATGYDHKDDRRVYAEMCENRDTLAWLLDPAPGAYETLLYDVDRP